MARKTVSTVRFGCGLMTHAVDQKPGYTACSIWIASSKQVDRAQRPPNDVNCWQCRKGAGLLRPRKGKVLTATMPGAKIHVISLARNGKRSRRTRTPCSLDFTGIQKAVIKMRSRSEVTCGHCQRFCFE